MKLGIFDSGIGGEAIANAMRKTFSNFEILVVNDHEHVPYGSRTADEIFALTDSAIQPLLSSNCDVIIIACNTATALAIDDLRKKYPRQKFVGIEPMIKTAAKLTKSNIIAVCATPATLKSDRYHKLVQKYGSKLNIIEPDCSNWAQMIENNQINYQNIDKIVRDVCSKGADVIVLGCTHYQYIKEHIIKLTEGQAKVIEPSKNICHRIEQLLKLG